MQKLTRLLTCVILALLATACGKSSVSDNTQDAQSAAQSSVLKIAKPKPYQKIEDTALGVNENGKGMKLGERITAVTVADINGNPYHIQQAWSEKPALVIFYRGGWCPYCNMQVHELAMKHPQLEAAGVQTILISVNEPDKAAMLDAQYNIPFPVLSDPQLIAHNAFNVVLELDEKTLARYKEWGKDLSAWSGQQHNKIAVASVFLINQNGQVLFSHAPQNYRSRPSVEQLVAMINKTLPAD